jgi:hypothetical protein
MDLIVREAEPEDAEQLFAHNQAIASEPELQLLVESEEFRLTLREERQWLKYHLASRNSTLLVAEAGG